MSSYKSSQVPTPNCHLYQWVVVAGLVSGLWSAVIVAHRVVAQLVEPVGWKNGSFPTPKCADMFALVFLSLLPALQACCSEAPASTMRTHGNPPGKMVLA